MDASYTQTSFLGGEISQWAQGQFDKPWYKMSLSRCFNAQPSDEGACPRRPGTAFLGTTRNGLPGRQLSFNFTESTPYNLELTDNNLRMWSGSDLVTANDSQVIASISNDSPAAFTVPVATEWSTGDTVTFDFSDPDSAVTGNVLLNRQFSIIVISPTSFSIVDSVTKKAINYSDIGASLTPTVNHVLNIPTSYSKAGYDWDQVRLVQGYNVGAFLHPGVAPQALQVLTPPTADKFATFNFSAANFQDGPYLDPPANSIASPSAVSGVITITVGYNAWSSSTVYGIGVLVSYDGMDYISLQNNNVNNTPSAVPASWQVLASGSMINSGSGFQPTDVGRMVRLFYAPSAWDPSTTYSAGENVSYNGEYFTSLINSNTNNEPDISLSDWTINTSIAYWTWGVITAVPSLNSAYVQINGAPLLDTTAIQEYQLGAWSNTTGWPTCGCYQQGRFWYAGAIPNRIDSSNSNDPFNMAPTAQDGTVGDSNGISYTFNADSQNPILWLQPDHQGILGGTQEGEWLITAGTSGAPMTPSNIQANRETKYGCYNILPVRTGLTICFVQRFKRRLLEYLVDVFSQRFYGPDLTTNARHLGSRGIEELAYQQELIPTVWARCTDGSLIGTTYRRTSLFTNQPPEFNAWHQHQLGSNRLLESICVGPSSAGTLDALGMVTNDPTSNVRYCESLTQMLDETDPLTRSWFLDTAVVPGAAQIANNAVTFYGLNYLNGKKVSVFAAALDCGDYIVENGQVTVPLATTIDPVSGIAFDIPQFNILQPQAATFSDMAVTVIGGAQNYSIPCVIGFNYQTQGQLCRPQTPQDTGAKNGPGFGKKRRTSKYAIQLSNAMAVNVGTKFSRAYAAPLTKIDAGGIKLNYLETFSGIIRETLADDFSYDSMLCWETTRPYPCTVTALGGFIETVDL